MSMQIADSYRVDGERYIMVRAEVTDFFNPCDYGFRPKKSFFCNRKGYLCEYRIENACLYLEKMQISTVDDVYPEVNGTACCSPGRYMDIHLPIRCTGRLLLSDEQPDSCFWISSILRAKKLYEYDFVEGEITSIIDHSRAASVFQKMHRSRLLYRMAHNDERRLFNMLPGKLRKPLNWIWNFKPVTREEGKR